MTNTLLTQALRENFFEKYFFARDRCRESAPGWRRGKPKQGEDRLARSRLIAFPVHQARGGSAARL
jgi:hypothetical protein